MFWKDEEELESNVLTFPQLLQPVPPNHKSLKEKEHRPRIAMASVKGMTYEEPVSRMTLKDSGGEPTAIEPK